jgi:short-subunit dehydrogenase
VRVRLKPLSQQTLVITGATSGHGLATALRAARAGAAVLLAARDEGELASVKARILNEGGRAETVVADVSQEADVQRIVEAAETHFGGFDTWVNNAGVGIYGALEDTLIDDHRKVFETNYWGVVHGSLQAVKHLRSREGGGALINVGSVNGDMPTPLLGPYNASKHAVKGFTNSLRLELRRAGAPVSVTLIKPAAIGTPFPEHGRNLTGARARLPQPIYSPELVADAILYAAQHPRRAITVGGAGRLQVAAFTLAPALFDRLAPKMDSQLVDEEVPVGFHEGTLWEPAGDTPSREGRQKGRRYSLYTTAQTHPAATAAAVAAVGLGLAALLARKPARAMAGLAAARIAAGMAHRRPRHRLHRLRRELEAGVEQGAAAAARAGDRARRALKRA